MAEIGKGYILSKQTGGDLSRTIYELQQKINEIEQMKGDLFSLGVARMIFMMPSIGVKTTF
jgi:hypothetical protein|tara:strand:+ start:9666 stop:9848 length:183 start_codon:yes stop_codon:yes gene_type:complete